MSTNPQDQQSSESPQVLIRDFLMASNVEEARRLSAPMLQTSVAARLAKDPALGTAFKSWWDKVCDGAWLERLDALALLWRLTSLSAMSQHRRELVSRINENLAAPFPPLSTLADPKDRRGAAEALLAASKEPWIAEYAAEAIVNDSDPKSDARDVMAAVILKQTGNVGDAFGLLTERFEKVVFQQQDPAAGRARRVAWILRSFRQPLYEDETVGADEDFGGFFAQFVTKALGSASPLDGSAAVDSAREIMLTLGAIVRLHGLRLATHADSYAVVDILRRRFVSTEWPVEMQEPVSRLSSRVAEALLVLARQGIADSGLRRVYVTLLGHVTAGMKLREMVADNDGLDPEIAYWMETGQARERLESSAAIEETATSLVDLELARAIREAFMADQAVANGRSPNESLHRMARELREAARKRGIVLRGQPGDLVDFSPHEHDIDSALVGRRRVVLVTPIVERIAGGRSIAVLLKGQVAAEGMV